MFNFISLIRSGALQYNYANRLIDAKQNEPGTIAIFGKSRITKPVTFGEIETQKISDSIKSQIQIFLHNEFSMLMIGSKLNKNILTFKASNVAHRVYIFYWGTNIDNKNDVCTEYSIDQNINNADLIGWLYLKLYKAKNSPKVASDITNIAHGRYNFILYDQLIDKLIIVKQDLPLSYYFEQYKLFLLSYKYDPSLRLEIMPKYTMYIIDTRSILMEEVIDLMVKPEQDTILVPVRNDLVSTVLPFILTKFLNKDIVLYTPDIRLVQFRLAKRLTRILADKLGINYFVDGLKNTKITDDIDQKIVDYILMINTLIYAKEQKISLIALSYTIEDWLTEFENVTSMCRTMNYLFGNKFSFIIPTASLTRKDLIEIGTVLDAPLEQLIFCDNPIKINDIPKSKKVLLKHAHNIGLTYLPCGKCSKCLERKMLYYQLQLADPLNNVFVSNENDEVLAAYKQKTIRHGIIDVDQNYISRVTNYFKQKIENDIIWLR